MIFFFFFFSKNSRYKLLQLACKRVGESWTERKIKEQETRVREKEKKRNMVDSAKWKSKSSNGYRPNLGRVFRLFSLATQGIYICYFSRKPLHYFALLRFLPSGHRRPALPPPRPVSFRSGPAKAGQYVILAVSLFLRTKAGSKLEKPRHAHNGRNPAAFPPPFERNLGCVQATTTILSRNSRFFIFSRFSHLFRIKI